MMQTKVYLITMYILWHFRQSTFYDSFPDYSCFRYSFRQSNSFPISSVYVYTNSNTFLNYHCHRCRWSTFNTFLNYHCHRCSWSTFNTFLNYHCHWCSWSTFNTFLNYHCHRCSWSTFNTFLNYHCHRCSWSTSDKPCRRFT